MIGACRDWGLGVALQDGLLSIIEKSYSIQILQLLVRGFGQCPLTPSNLRGGANMQWNKELV